MNKSEKMLFYKHILTLKTGRVCSGTDGVTA